jgi:hypothetical protein
LQHNKQPSTFFSRNILDYHSARCRFLVPTYSHGK